MFGLSGLTFAVPAMLGGLALIAMPIAAHLLHRRPRTYLVFPTIRLLREAVATQSRLSRLRRWLLLALRCLLVLLVAFAFAQPLWQSAQATPQGQAAAVVLLIDTSASVRQEANGLRLWSSLQAAAERTLGSLHAGLDVANVVEASARPRVVLPRLTANLSAVTQEVQELQPTFERADFPRALSLAAEQLSRHPGQRRVVILSDLQQSSWKTVSVELASVLPSGTQVTLVEPASEPPENIALSAPRAHPPQPLVRQPVQLAVRVTNFSTRERQARMGATINGKDLPEQTVVLQPGEEREVPFAAEFEAAGEQQVEFFTTADGFSPDDRVSQVVTVSERLPVLIVSDDLPTDAGSGTFFLARALAPTSTPADRFDVRQILGRELATADLAQAGLVFVGYLGELDEAGAERLVQFIQQGGAAVFFCGEGAVSRQLEVLESAAGETGLLPWKPGPVRRLDALDDAVFITAGKWQSRLLQEFDDSSQLALARVRFHRPYAAEELHPASDVLLSFSDETPALGRRGFGSGQFLLANFSPSLASSDLGKHGVFVALVQILAQELRPAVESRAAAFAGDAFRFPPPRLPAAVAKLEIEGPDRTKSALALPVPGQPYQAAIDRPRLPGLYSLQADGRTVATAAIQLDPRESDLRRFTANEVLARLKPSGAAQTLKSSDDWAALSDLHARPLWPWCLTLALVALAAELLLLATWRKPAAAAPPVGQVSNLSVSTGA